eukprot:20319-Heterococcus_DN1.PRE.5
MALATIDLTFMRLCLQRAVQPTLAGSDSSSHTVLHQAADQHSAGTKRGPNHGSLGLRPKHLTTVEQQLSRLAAQRLSPTTAPTAVGPAVWYYTNSSSTNLTSGTNRSSTSYTHPTVKLTSRAYEWRSGPSPRYASRGEHLKLFLAPKCAQLAVDIALHSRCHTHAATVARVYDVISCNVVDCEMLLAPYCAFAIAMYTLVPIIRACRACAGTMDIHLPYVQEQLAKDRRHASSAPLTLIIDTPVSLRHEVPSDACNLDDLCVLLQYGMYMAANTVPRFPLGRKQLMKYHRSVAVPCPEIPTLFLKQYTAIDALVSDGVNLLAQQLKCSVAHARANSSVPPHVLEPVAPEDDDTSEPVPPKHSRHDAAAMCAAQHRPFSSLLSAAAPVSTLLLKDTCPMLEHYALEAAEVVSLQQQQQQQQQQQCDVHHLGLCTLTPDNTYYNVRYTPPLLCPQRLLQQPSMSVQDSTAVPSTTPSRYTHVVYGFVFVGVVVVVVVSC